MEHSGRMKVCLLFLMKLFPGNQLIHCTGYDFLFTCSCVHSWDILCVYSCCTLMDIPVCALLSYCVLVGCLCVGGVESGSTELVLLESCVVWSMLSNTYTPVHVCNESYYPSPLHSTPLPSPSSAPPSSPFSFPSLLLLPPPPPSPQLERRHKMIGG